MLVIAQLQKPSAQPAPLLCGEHATSAALFSLCNALILERKTSMGKKISSLFDVMVPTDVGDARLQSHQHEHQTSADINKIAKAYPDFIDRMFFIKIAD